MARPSKLLNHDRIGPASLVHISLYILPAKYFEILENKFREVYNIFVDTTVESSCNSGSGT